MEFPWRCNVDTIAMDLKVSWEMSVQTLATALSFPPGAKRRGAAANAPSRAVSHNARRRRLRLLELS